MTDVRTEIEDATGVAKKKSETNDAYLARLVGATKKLSDAKWEELSEPAQQWVNDSVKALEDDEEIPEFPDEEEAEADGEEDEPEEEEAEEEEAPVKAKAKSKGKSAAAKANGKAKGKAKAAEPDEEEDGEEEEDEAPKAKAKGKSAAKKKAAKEPKPAGVRRRVKQMMLKNPKLTVDAIAEKLDKEGLEYARGTIVTTRHDTLDTLRVGVEVGVLDIDVPTR